MTYLSNLTPNFNSSFNSSGPTFSALTNTAPKPHVRLSRRITEQLSHTFTPVADIWQSMQAPPDAPKQEITHLGKIGAVARKLELAAKGEELAPKYKKQLVRELDAAINALSNNREITERKFKIKGQRFILKRFAVSGTGGTQSIPYGLYLPGKKKPMFLIKTLGPDMQMFNTLWGKSGKFPKPERPAAWSKSEFGSTASAFRSAWYLKGLSGLRQFIALPILARPFTSTEENYPWIMMPFVKSKRTAAQQPDSEAIASQIRTALINTGVVIKDDALKSVDFVGTKLVDSKGIGHDGKTTLNQTLPLLAATDKPDDLAAKAG